ncbi:AI-2E family transporter [Haloarchaeobius sp. TZWWS8]|uniref:AI-2E family transporter n=1 Tax=Haloarchaeobius sp. TZWWS8 TaxID=3446121 RepID=UPI003EBE2445
MQLNRRVVLTLLVLVAGVLAWATLSAVFGTVFFALTVASVVSPVQTWLEGRGLPSYWAGVLTTLVTFVGGLAVFVPVAVIAYVRRERLIELVRQLPPAFTTEILGVSYSVELGEVENLVVTYLSSFAVTIAKATPDLALKAALFVMVLFAFLVEQDRVYRAAIAVVPPSYRDIADAFVERASDTLFAIYVLQIATALGTFLIALPVFWVLGYEYWVSMAAVAGVLQFLPIIGPSVLIGATALWHVSQGDLPSAIVVAVVGGIVIGYLPDAVIRPRLAQMTADMPGSLYFIGFIGGLLSVGPVGVIAGPLVVALFSESLELLSEAVNGEDEDPLRTDPIDDATDAATAAAAGVIEEAEESVAETVDVVEDSLDGTDGDADDR